MRCLHITMRCCTYDEQAGKQSNTTEDLVVAQLHRSLSHSKHYHIYEGVHLPTPLLDRAKSS